MRTRAGIGDGINLEGIKDLILNRITIRVVGHCLGKVAVDLRRGWDGGDDIDRVAGDDRLESPQKRKFCFCLMGPPIERQTGFASAPASGRN